MTDRFRPASEYKDLLKQAYALHRLCQAYEAEVVHWRTKYDVASFYARTLDPIAIQKEKDINTMLTNALDLAEDEISALRHLLKENNIAY